MNEKGLRIRDVLGEGKAQKQLTALFESLPPEPTRRGNFLQEVAAVFSKAFSAERVKGLQEVLQNFPVDSFETDETFVTAVTEAVLDLDRNFDPTEVEKIQRKNFVEQGKSTPLNEILAYGYDDGIVHIHLANTRTLGPKQFITAVTDGLEKLAKLLTQPGFEEAKVITATSFIVAEHPGLLEHAGFTIDGPISEVTRRRHFRTETRPISASHMDREDFLKHYLK